jgi:hypothetical protein
MDIMTAHNLLRTRIRELKDTYAVGSPWIFLSAAALVEYLAKLVNGADKGGSGYKDFVTQWMARVRTEYKDFKYKNGTTDLPVQMYHVLRCGIVHSLSLVPDNRAIQSGGRERSIGLLFRAESIEKNLLHLHSYSTTEMPDAVLFVAEDFVEDIEKAIELIFHEAITDAILANNIQSWLKEHPLLKGGF